MPIGLNRSPLFSLMMFQIAVLADDILKNVEYDALRVVFNKFHSVISFKPTMTTILSPEVNIGAEDMNLCSYKVI